MHRFLGLQPHSGGRPSSHHGDAGAGAAAATPRVAAAAPARVGKLTAAGVDILSY
jgi:hypothetical protein